MIFTCLFTTKLSILRVITVHCIEWNERAHGFGRFGEFWRHVLAMLFGCQNATQAESGDDFTPHHGATNATNDVFCIIYQRLSTDEANWAYLVLHNRTE
jgi:hypothetical protein